VIVEHLELIDFRNYREIQFDLDAGVTAVVGDNGQGKTNLAEALGYLATLSSFRGVPSEALVRQGATTAVIRATILDEDDRRSLIEAEVSSVGRNRVLVNRQRLGRARDLLGVMRVTVFSPDDLVIVKGSPGDRRRFLDDALVAMAAKYDAIRLELDRVLRQRNRLLKQAGGRLTEEIEATLDVWDAKLAETGERLGTARAVFLERAAPVVAEAYSQLAGAPAEVLVDYAPPWRSVGLDQALKAARLDDLRRGVSTVGPHRDELTLWLNGLPARTHASQGEQRTLALALRLATHRLVAEHSGATPVLVLDDVLSELDPGRAAALLAHVPPGQVIITTATPLPTSAAPDRVLRIRSGTLVG
jgi:DNA replication and repair protein RecF